MTPTYRVRLIFPAGNTKKTLRVRATSGYLAESHARELYSGGVVKSCLPRTPPEDADVHDLEAGTFGFVCSRCGVRVETTHAASPVAQDGRCPNCREGSA